MQKQNPGIEWTRVHGRPGYTWNVVTGCYHNCQWVMPDGAVAECYAKTIAERVAGKFYPEGFAHHYFHPKRLEEPLKLKTPAGIFLDSMSDLMGKWVPSDEIKQVLDVCGRAHWHKFFLLTKNPIRLLSFEFPPNVWVGVSSPPDYLWGTADKPHRLERDKQENMLRNSLDVLRVMGKDYRAAIRWMSFEPLSWDVSQIVAEYPTALDWAVIGAASNGRQLFPPDDEHLVNLNLVLDDQGVPIFYKGNMRSSPIASANWRENSPDGRPTVSATG